MQYVAKSETKFNIRPNNHIKDVTRRDSIPVSSHFDIEGHNFNIYAKFMLIEQLNQTNLNRKEDSHKSLLKRRHDQKIIPDGLRITLEPSIGNFDDECNKKLYERLNNFSWTLMKDVFGYCDKTVERVLPAIESKVNKKTPTQRTTSNS